MNPLFIRSALITTFFTAVTSYAQEEIYFQPVDRICYETYYGNGSSLPPSAYTPDPVYAVTPGVISLPTNDCYGETFFRVDFLYWKTNENKLSRCIPIQTFDRTDCDGYAVSIRKEKNKDLSFDWAPGFRIALGHRFLETCWELAACWSNLYTKASTHLADQGRLRCRLNFNAVDLLAGYTFCVVPAFTLKPYFGLRVATVHQTLKTNIESNNESPSYTHVQGHNKEKFVGIGPLIGLEGVFSLKYGASIYASAAVAGLYGDYDLNFKRNHRICDAESIYQLKQHLHSWDAALDFTLGFRWEHCLKKTFSRCSPNMRVTLDLGLEHHHYFKLNRFNSDGLSASKRRGSDLYFDGFNVAVKLAY